MIKNYMYFAQNYLVESDAFDKNIQYWHNYANIMQIAAYLCTKNAMLICKGEKIYKIYFH